MAKSNYEAPGSGLGVCVSRITTRRLLFNPIHTLDLILTKRSLCCASELHTSLAAAGILNNITEHTSKLILPVAALLQLNKQKPVFVTKILGLHDIDTFRYTRHCAASSLLADRPLYSSQLESLALDLCSTIFAFSVCCFGVIK